MPWCHGIRSHSQCYQLMFAWCFAVNWHTLSLQLAAYHAVVGRFPVTYLKSFVFVYCACHFKIIVTSIIIGKTASFWAVACLRRFCQIRPSGFHFLVFRNKNFLCRARSSALCPTPNLKDHVSLFMYPSDRASHCQLYRQAPGSLFVAFFYPQGYCGSILTRLYAGKVFTHDYLCWVQSS
jgi:hypothetical protein